MNTVQKQRLNEISQIVNGSRYEQGRFYDLHGSSFGPGPKYRGDAGDLLKEVLSIVKEEAPSTLLSSEVAVKIAMHIKGKNSDYFCMREGLAELESIISSHFANAALTGVATAGDLDK